MVNVDVTSPQLKAVKGMADAFASRDLSNLEPILSKDFTLKSFPKVAEFPDLGKEEYLEGYGAAFSLFAKVEVIFYEVIEAPGKVVTHLTILSTAADGTTVDYETLLILSFVEEDGEVKFLEAKDFCDPEKRVAFHVEVGKLLTKVTAVA